jgi:hypothetical protein
MKRFEAPALENETQAGHNSKCVESSISVSRLYNAIEQPFVHWRRQIDAGSVTKRPATTFMVHS